MAAKAEPLIRSSVVRTEEAFVVQAEAAYEYFCLLGVHCTGIPALMHELFNQPFKLLYPATGLEWMTLDIRCLTQ